MDIVIVDDSELVRERVAKRVTEIPGINVTGEAGSSIEAMDILRSHQPNVMILDIKMPGESGIEVLRRVKEEYPQIKVIMLTNYPFLQYRSKCYEYGVDYFLDKSEEFEKVTDILVELEKNTSMGVK
ncbi:MAG: response regulator transcription factor [Ignavibacteria bacterium]|jgi:DNA-binding NarL/FixJ family response regulator